MNFWFPKTLFSYGLMSLIGAGALLSQSCVLLISNEALYDTVNYTEEAFTTQVSASAQLTTFPTSPFKNDTQQNNADNIEISLDPVDTNSSLIEQFCNAQQPAKHKENELLSQTEKTFQCLNEESLKFGQCSNKK